MSEPRVGERRPAAELVAQGTGLLDSTHLAELGLSEKAIEALWRNVPVVRLPDFVRPLVPVEAYVAYIAGHTYCDRCGDRVRPGRKRARIGEPS